MSKTFFLLAIIVALVAMASADTFIVTGFDSAKVTTEFAAGGKCDLTIVKQYIVGTKLFAITSAAGTAIPSACLTAIARTTGAGSTGVAVVVTASTNTACFGAFATPVTACGQSATDCGCLVDTTCATAAPIILCDSTLICDATSKKCKEAPIVPAVVQITATSSKKLDEVKNGFTDAKDFVTACAIKAITVSRGSTNSTVVIQYQSNVSSKCTTAEAVIAPKSISDVISAPKVAVLTVPVDKCVNGDKIKCAVDEPLCVGVLCSAGTKCTGAAQCASNDCQKDKCNSSFSISTVAVALVAVIAAFVF